MSGGAGSTARTSPRRCIVELAVLALAPAIVSFASAPGRMPADTKLGLYFDPGGLIADAARSFDPGQFGGWVPHQSISYLWPSGPWFLVGDVLGLPDWVVHRAWIAVILFAAGAGARWCARLLGIGASGAFVAAMVYELSPYVVPYVSRTSLMLLPFAGLGWVVGLTICAAHRGGWRHPAALALVVATIGAPNATALVMIVPAPVLWLAFAASRHELSWRRALATGARIGVLCTLTSLWWVAMLVVQGRHGADVLAYSESLEAVSFTSSSVETLRGLGYWLFYVRDPVGFATAGAEVFMTSVPVLVASVALTGLGLVGLVACRFSARGYAALLVVTGAIVAIGVHPIDDPAPLFAPFAEASTSRLVLAFRSSTRALPLVALGLGLGTGAATVAGMRWLRARRPQLAAVPAMAVIVIAIVAAPTWWGRDFVDPLLERDSEPPPGWTEAAAALDRTGSDARVLQLPGQEFGVYRWGTTVDQPMATLADTPLITRDLLPLGSPPMMDLLYALDDRFQDGIVESASLAPVARWLGADTVALVHDIVADRYRTPRPETIATLFEQPVEGLGEPRTFGAAAPAGSLTDGVSPELLVGPGIGRPVAPLWLLDVDDPVPVVRAKTHVVAVAGTGDGLVDAAAAGLLDGSELIRYTATVAASETVEHIVVTDSGRTQARHWRGSQDTRGFTEDADDRPDVLRRDPADRRLDVYGTDATALDGPAVPHTSTVVEQVGPVQVRATAYGEPFAYRPEDRPAMAVDGDLRTAWRVADRADPVGERIELVVDEPTSELVVRQPDRAATGVPTNRWITALDVDIEGTGQTVRVTLDDSSRRGGGQQVQLPAATTRISLTIADVVAAPGSGDGVVATGLDAVGFAEIAVGDRGPTTEVTVPPRDWVDLVGEGTTIDWVYTRLRADPFDRWRHDPEPRLVRSLLVPEGASAAIERVELRLAPEAADDVLATALGFGEVTTADARIAGALEAGGWSASDGDKATAWIGPMGTISGLELQLTTDEGPVAELLLEQAGGAWSEIRRVTVSDAAGDERSIEVARDTSRYALEPPLTGGRWTLRIDEAVPSTGWERRTAEAIARPVAIAQLAGGSPRPLPTAVDLGCRDDLLELGGQPVALDLGVVDVDALLRGAPVDAQPCDDVAVPAGEHVLASTSGRGSGFDVDRIVLRALAGRTDAATGASPLTTPRTGSVDVELRSSGPLHRVAEISPCPDGCWLVLGEGRSDAWRAELAGVDLGPSTLVDGGSNGWWLPPSTGTRSVSLRWTAQPPVTWALVVSALSAIGCVVVVSTSRRRSPQDAPGEPTRDTATPAWADLRRRRPRAAARWPPVVVAGVASALLVGPQWMLPAVVIAGLAAWWRLPRLIGLAALGAWALIGATLVWRVARYEPFADPGWVRVFDDRHELGAFALSLLLATVTVRDDHHRPTPPTSPAVRPSPQ